MLELCPRCRGNGCVLCGGIGFKQAKDERVFKIKPLKPQKEFPVLLRKNLKEVMRR